MIANRLKPDSQLPALVFVSEHQTLLKHVYTELCLNIHAWSSHRLVLV